jgi:Spy/CpxP family protein refolding chaperone
MISRVERRQLIAAVLLLGAAGCGARAAEQPPAATPATATNDDEGAALMEHHRYHHGGVTLFIAMSLDTIGVSPEQRAAIQTIRADLHAAMEPQRRTEQTLLGTLADGLSAGSFDAAKVDAALAQVDQAAALLHDASANSVNRLHDVLTPGQRAALVDKVSSHWAVWKHENEETDGPTSGRHLAALTTDLGLTPDQVTRIHAAVADGIKGVPRVDDREIAAHLRLFGDAFRADTFDAKTLPTGTPANVHMIGWGATHLVRVVETMSPILTPDQRAALADQLREHATHGSGPEGQS